MRNPAPNGKFDGLEPHRQFQLYLLTRMRLLPDKLDYALRFLQSSENELMELKLSRAGIGFDQLGGQNESFYRDLLGDPSEESEIIDPSQPLPFRSYRRLAYHLSLWPEFDFIIKVTPDEGTFDPEFERSPRGLIPNLNEPADLAAWKFVRKEVDQKFGKPKVTDGWDCWQEVEYVISTPNRADPQKWFALFDFELIQDASIL
jgi:hypothetical protein